MREEVVGGIRFRLGEEGRTSERSVAATFRQDEGICAASRPNIVSSLAKKTGSRGSMRQEPRRHPPLV